jgi:hypothetical protein
LYLGSVKLEWGEEECYTSFVLGGEAGDNMFIEKNGIQSRSFK